MFHYMQIKDSDYKEIESIKKENKKKKQRKSIKTVFIITAARGTSLTF